MASTRDIRRRIKSVKSTKQITKAMELVATSKMRRASEATLASRPYTAESWQIVQDILSRPQDEQISHPLLQARAVKNVLIVAIASDRGLAGVYNAAVSKLAYQLLKEQQAAGHQVSFITMGRKIEQSVLQFGAPILQSYPHLSTHPLVEDIWPLASFLVESYLGKQFDQVLVVYTNFTSLLRQEATSKQLIPLKPEALPEEARSWEFLFEPTPREVLDSLLPRLVEIQLYQSILESLASEHAARRIAMKNATDNASEMIDDLTLTYNGLRQSAITQEIAEITSGAASLAV